MSTTEAPFTLKVERNEVPVRVVVRDREGRPVRNLTREDFQILDNGKPQAITQFSVENATAPATPVEKSTAEAKPPATPVIADRFVALYFDDLVMDFEGIARTREAASKYLQTSIQQADRVAIYTSSGRGNLDFTSDRDNIQEAIKQLRFTDRHARAGPECPPISDYEAYRLAYLNDSDALANVESRVLQCLCHGNAAICPESVLLSTAQGAAEIRWTQVEREAVDSLRGLQGLVRRMSVMPGQRSIVMISEGFISGSQMRMTSEIIDNAVRAGVVVNALDSRGLFTTDPNYQPVNDYHTELVLGDIAAGTGGVFYHHSNDYDAGFRLTGGLADFSYVLVFSPSDLKPDGKYHQLKISLTGGAKDSKFTVQARSGYFAAITLQDVPRKVEAELTTAMYSRDETNRSRIRIGTRFFKSTPTEAQVTIVAHLDTQGLAFRTENGRHATDLTFATVIFDNDGNFVQGLRKSLALHLRDATLNRVRAAGISVTSDFKIPPGTYLVREIVRDGGGVISTLNNTLEIPY